MTFLAEIFLLGLPTVTILPKKSKTLYFHPIDVTIKNNIIHYNERDNLKLVVTVSNPFNRLNDQTPASPIQERI